MSPHLFLIVCCFYQIQVQAFPSAKLTANKHTITETDSVTLHCQAPSYVSVLQCYFYTDRGQTPEPSSCLRTLTGTDLLSMSQQRSPANVDLKCFYTVKYGDNNSPSPHSDSVSIAVHSQKPQLSFSDLGDEVLFACSLPESVEHGTKCNLYIGESNHPVATTTTLKDRSSKNQKTCQFSIKRDDLLTHLRVVQLKEASCDYSLRHEPTFVSARSDGRSFTDSFLGTETQALVPPELTVTPLLITESDSVTLNCQTPSSVPVSQCFFNFAKNKLAKLFSCQTSLTGTELLQITNQNSPAEVAVTCFYLKTHQSPNSNVSSITVQLPRPQLTVTPLLITESDSVTLNCQTPSSVPVFQCLLYSVRDRISTVVSCHQTLRGRELLTMMQQSSPAEVEVTCYYTVKLGEVESTSTGSQTSTIIVQTAAETQSDPAAAVTPAETSDLSSNNEVFSSTSPTASGETAGLSASASLTSEEPTSGETAGHSTSASLTSVASTSVSEVISSTLISSNEAMNPTAGDNFSRNLIKKLFVIVTGFGATVGVTGLGLVLFYARRRNVKSSYQRSQVKQSDELLNISHKGSLPVGCNEGYSEITSAPGVSSHPDSRRLTRQVSDSESNIYHVYATISEEPAEAAPLNAMYNTLQAH